MPCRQLNGCSVTRPFLSVRVWLARLSQSPPNQSTEEGSLELCWKLSCKENSTIKLTVKEIQVHCSLVLRQVCGYRSPSRLQWHEKKVRFLKFTGTYNSHDLVIATITYVPPQGYRSPSSVSLAVAPLAVRGHRETDRDPYGALTWLPQ